jgi:hypothetical protein
MMLVRLAKEGLPLGTGRTHGRAEAAYIHIPSPLDWRLTGERRRAGVKPTMSVSATMRMLLITRRRYASDLRLGRAGEHAAPPAPIVLRHRASTFTLPALHVSGLFLASALTPPTPIESHPEEIWSRPRHLTHGVERQRVTVSHHEQVRWRLDRGRYWSPASTLEIAKRCGDVLLNVHRSRVGRGNITVQGLNPCAKEGTHQNPLPSLGT